MHAFAVPFISIKKYTPTKADLLLSKVTFQLWNHYSRSETIRTTTQYCNQYNDRN